MSKPIDGDRLIKGLKMNRLRILSECENDGAAGDGCGDSASVPRMWKNQYKNSLCVRRSFCCLHQLRLDGTDEILREGSHARLEHPGGGGDGGDGMSRYDYLFLNGKSLMFWALEWFSMSNDAFFHCYGFNFNPHKYPGLYEQARARYFSKEAQP